MNTKPRTVAWLGILVGSALALAATGCRSSHVHYTRTVYVPAPPPVIVTSPPAPAPPPPPVVAAPPTVVQPAPPVIVPSPPVVVINTESDFYEPLTPHGHWVVVPGYGRVWMPARVEAGWRPYANGYWQRTDAGWYWMSEEPWGWATYHYGRWDWHAQYGWIWIPQTQWAPAWVCWREGDGYIGWAPLRPSATIGVSLSTVNYEPAFASRAFVFVEHRRMLEPIRPKTVIVNNTTIINRTVNITNVKVVNKTVINEGPKVEALERESGRKIHALSVNEFRHREETAVAARERNLPARIERKTEPTVRKQISPAPTPTPAPRETRTVEKLPTFKPVERVTQTVEPVTRPTPSKPSVTQAPRREPERKTGASPGTREPSRAVEARGKPAALSTRTNPSPSPTPAVNKSPQVPKTLSPPVAATTPRKEPRRESPRQIPTPTLPQAAAGKPAVPTATSPLPQRQASPRAKSQASEQGAAAKPKTETEAKSERESGRGTSNGRETTRTQPR